MADTRRYIVTVDQGTTSTATAIWDADGSVLAETTVGYELDRPHPGWAEIHPDRWVDALGAAAGSVLRQSGVPADQVAMVAVSGISWTLVPVDAALKPLLPAMTWMDRRAEPQAAAMRARPDADALVDLAANPIDAAYITPKLAWLREQRPDIDEQTRWYLTSTGYFAARLTGEPTCDLTQAYAFHCFDIRRERWDETAAASLGIPIDRLPPLKRLDQVAGIVTAGAAARSGLAAGTPVLVGGLDSAIGALGGGVIHPGQTQDQGGQAGGMGMCVTDVVVEPRLIFSHHAIADRYLLQSGTVGGGSLGWLRRILGRPDAPFGQLSAEADTVPPGSGGVLFLPYMAGERTPIWSSTARGVFFGLSYSTTPAQLVRAVLEGCAFAVYDGLRLAEDRGLEVSEWLGQGGAARSGVWNQIKADISGRPFVVPRRQDGTEGGHGLGLFALGAAAAGLADDPASAMRRLLPRRTVWEPNPRRHERYQELFALWRDLSRHNLPQFDRLAEVMSAEGWEA